MAMEIERRFLVRGRPWEGTPGRALVQGYLADRDGVAVRVRIDGAAGWLTVKGPSQGARRVEVEVELPLHEAEQLLALCGERVVHKVRHEVVHAGHLWEVDVFEGRNAGLVVAEVELDDEAEAFDRPTWLGEEVTDDHRYANLALAQVPWSAWGRA